MFDLPFDSLTNLFKQAFCFRKYRKMHRIFAVLLCLPALPFFLISLLLFAFYEICIFIFNFLKSTADYLLLFIKDVGSNVQHATQAVVYFIGFPLVFFINAMMAFIVPILFIVYFFINVFTYLWTLGDIKFNAYITKKVEREFNTPNS